MTILHMLFFSFMTVMLFYILASIVSIVKNAVRLKQNKLDELQKLAIYESFALSFSLIIIIHLLQLILFYFDINLTKLISPGPINSGIIYMNNNFFHIDSFFFDCLILSFIYFLKKIQYSLLSTKQIIKKITIPAILTLFFFLLGLAGQYLSN